MGIIKPSLGKKAQGGFKKPGVFQPSGFGGRPVVKPSFGGGGKGQGGGQWVFVPQNAAPMRGKGGGRNVIQQVQQLFAKGGKGKHGKGNDKYKYMDKLDKIDAARKVWVGGLPKDCTRGNIVEHFKAVAHPGDFEIMSGGKACIAFKTPEDADNVIASLNGSDLNGSDIQVDVWTKKEKKPRAEGEQREKKQKTKLGVKASQLKGKKTLSPMDEKMKEKVRAVDHSLKVWVGGMAKDTTWKAIKEHFTNNGVEVDLVGLMKPGTACVTFKTEDEVANAISINGTDLAGETLQVDVWTKPERKEKKKKGEAEE